MIKGWEHIIFTTFFCSNVLVAGMFFSPSDKVVADYPDIAVADNYTELLAMFSDAID